MEVLVLLYRPAVDSVARPLGVGRCRIVLVALMHPQPRQPE